MNRTASFYQQAGNTALGQSLHHLRHRQHAVCQRQTYHLYVRQSSQRFRLNDIGIQTGKDNRIRQRIQNCCHQRNLQVAVEHHAHRIFAAHQTGGQLRIILQHRADADKHSVMLLTQAVCEGACLLAGNPFAVARCRGNLAIKCHSVF